MFVYVIVNDVNLKIYIGKTTRPNLVQYLQQKCYEAGKRLGGNSHLYAAIRKYGREHFHIYPLFTGTTNVEICTHEQLLIKAFAVQNPEVGYNICRGGEGRTDKGWHHTPETRAKQSASNKGKHRERLMSPENQAKRVAAWQESLEEHNGSFHTLETSDKIKDARAQQDEAFRVEKQKEYERLHPERRVRAAATHKGKKHKMSSTGSVAISEAFIKTAHNRWHVKRGLKNSTCKLCNGDN